MVPNSRGSAEHFCILRLTELGQEIWQENVISVALELLGPKKTHHPKAVRNQQVKGPNRFGLPCQKLRGQRVCLELAEYPFGCAVVFGEIPLLDVEGPMKGKPPFWGPPKEDTLSFVALDLFNQST